jgi:hypothetical protein
MITAAQAIETANRDGFCKLSQHVFLWKTCEAATMLKIDGHLTPYFLITGPNGWDKPVKVSSEYNKKLIKACEAGNDTK